MYRFIYRAVYTARTSSFNIYESRLLPAKCDIAAAPVFRVANGGGAKALSTSSSRLCEKKDDVTSSNQDEKKNMVKEGEPTETPTLFEQKADDDSKVIKTDEQREEPAVLKTDGGGTNKETDVITGQNVEKPKHDTIDAAKSGKENLLDLLGAMKVEVTNKRKLKNLKVKQSYESTPKPKPAAMESTISMFQKATEEAATQSESLDPELVAAASAAASTLPNRSQAESELLKQLRQHESITVAQKKGDVNNLGVIIADMKVGKNTNRQKARPAHQIRFDDDGRGYTHDRGITAELDSVRRRRNLLSGKRLNIFSPATDEDGVDSAVARPTLWDMDFAHQLSQAPNQTARNGFEEMIQWTKEGKMWQYPVDNEAGLEEEASVPFHEHIFLEKHLEEGFPTQGPVRHFMELVVAGLSRNPYLTVEQKKEHISWFRDYFHQKENVLKEAEVYLN
ncbi:28S ribosomal protein S31, mitochondrial [Thunnus maccoyii]|uniref:28S ribosomal protein S31, mitochondrial n=1 Tax=Thunnus maccoyii TaxID=8240 RepID=UPI001C4CF877|nr:28S ribosomal protein S31, mitochondrial [Thunnus maccoyii]